MKRAYLVAVLGTVIGACGIASCGEEETTTPPRPATDSGTGTDTGGRDSTPSDGTSPTDSGTDATFTGVTVKAVQDPTDPAHPAPNATISLSDTDLVALTPRIFVSGTSCRFGVWVGKPGGGFHSGVVVMETLGNGECLDLPPGKIPNTIKPGDAVTAVEGVVYSEFFGQSQLFLGANGKITFGTTNTPPTPKVVPVSEIIKDSTAAATPQGIALEGTLVKVENVRLENTVETNDAGSFDHFNVFDGSDTAGGKPLEIYTTRTFNATCIRTYLKSKDKQTLASVTGVLIIDFNRWKIRLRDEKDIAGLTCAGPDAGSDASDAAGD